MQKKWLLIKALISIGLLFFLGQSIHPASITLAPLLFAKLLAVAIAIVALSVSLMAYRWHTILKTSNYKKCLEGYWIAMLFNLIAPGSIGGDALRITHSQLHWQLSLKKAFGIILQERLTGLLAINILLIIACLWIPPLPKTLLFYSPIVLDALIFGLIAAILALLTMIHKRWSSLSYQTFLTILIVSIAAQMGDILIAWLALKNTQYHVPLLGLLLIMPLVYIASVLPISLGGLGVRESLFATLLTLMYGVDVSTAICIGFLTYAAKLTIGLLLGIPALLRSPISWQNIKNLYHNKPAESL